MSQAMLLPAAALALGFLASLLFQMPRHLGGQAAPAVVAAPQQD
jgi:hypothetical protein